MVARRILIGLVGRPHGVRGLLRVHSYAAVPTDLAAYGPVQDDRGGRWSIAWRGDGIAAFTGSDGQTLRDRDSAQALAGRRLYVDRDRLPEAGEDEFYLADLVGLSAHKRADGMKRSLGTVLAVHDYGAGTSLEIGHVGRSVLLPFTRACVPEIDLAGGWMLVVPPDEIDLTEDRLAGDQLSGKQLP